MSPLEIYLAVGAVFASYLAVTERRDEVEQGIAALVFCSLVAVAYPLIILARVIYVANKRFRKRVSKLWTKED